MGRPKGSGKDPFDALDEAWKNSVAGMSPEDIDKSIAGIAKAQAENKKNQTNDLQVREASFEYNNATAGYKQKSRKNDLAQRIGIAKSNDTEITKAVKAEAVNQNEKSEDEVAATLKLTLGEAKAQYSEATKANKLKIKWCMRVLGDKGKV